MATKPISQMTRAEYEASRVGLRITRATGFVREQHDALGRYGGNVERNGFLFTYADGGTHFECAEAMNEEDYELFLSQQETDEFGLPYWPPSHAEAA